MTFISTTIDLTKNPMAAYELASEIAQTQDSEIIYLEIHKKSGNFKLDNAEGSFRGLAKRFDNGFEYPQKVDSFPAKIDVLLTLNRLRFQIEDCGENIYKGLGPNGVLALREACFKRGIKMKIELVD